MKCNVGGMDMAARLIIGVILLIVGFTIPLDATLQTVLFVLAAIALVTGAIRYCPLNHMLGISSCAKKNVKS